MLAQSAARAGFRLVSFDTLGSTNEEGLSRGRSGDPGHLWIVADHQSRGRGRLGRAWISPPGNLYASLLLVAPAPPHKAAELGFVAGLALARAVARFTPEGTRFFIKWPNDLVHDGAKFAGVLVEGTQDPDGRFAAVLGFGVNCSSCPEGLAYPTSQMSSFAAAGFTPQALFSALCATVAHTLRKWDGGKDFAAIREEWLGWALPAGAPLEARTGSRQVKGRFQSIDAGGRLLLAAEGGGVLTVEAADIILKDHDLLADRGKR